MRQGKEDGEEAAASGARALGADHSAVIRDHVADHIEAEAKAVVGPRAGAVLLPEAFEGERQEGGAHPFARVRNSHARLVVDQVHRDIDPAPRRSEFDRVRKQVGRGLLQAARIAADPERDGPLGPREGDALHRGIGGGYVHRDLNHAPQVDELGMEHQSARGDAGRVEQVFDDPLEGARAAIDDLKGAFLLGLIEASLFQEPEPHQDRTQGSAQFMGEEGQEFVLEVARRLGPVPGQFLALHETGDVAGHEAAVHVNALAEEADSVGEDLADGAVRGSQPVLVGLDDSPVGEAIQDPRVGVGLHHELGAGTADVFGGAHSQKIELRLIGPEDAAVRSHAAQADRGLSEELSQLRFALRQSHMAPAFHTLRRPARLATTVTSSEG